MTDSFRRIDYSIRPAKHAERRMLADVFRRLAAFEPLEAYRYVGFGSVWFSDFLLFHRALGIRKMLSIEEAATLKERFEANKPFSIEMDFRRSTLALPDLDYSTRQFIWLDYDDPISPDMLQDVSTVASRARSGTCLVISVQSHRAPQVAEADRDRAEDVNAISAEERFRSAFGAARVPQNLQRDDLIGWPFGSLARWMIKEEIRKALEIRKLANAASALLVKEIVDFEYEDGAKMTTVVVLFYSAEEKACVDAASFKSLQFFQNATLPIFIPTPKLTLREYRQLERQLPLAEGAELDVGHIPPGEAKSFASMYRYFPNFAVIES